jgi:Protein of unknown function (DUF2852)
MNTSATADTADFGKHEHRSCKKTRKWSSLEIATMIGGFVVYWPIGLVALGVKLVKGEMWNGSKHNVMPWTAYQNWRAEKGDKPFGFATPNWKTSSWTQGTSGNAAFDAYKKEQLDRLEAERRKLDEEQKAFGEHLAKLRRAKDQDEFDRFMSERAAPKPAEG